MEELIIPNNRELALLIWLAIFIAWALLKPRIREALIRVVRAFFVHKIIVPVALMVVYIIGLVAGFRYLGLWTTFHLTATILWSVSVALVSLMNLNSISEDEHYFRKVALEQVQLLVLVEFVVNFYVFDLWLELLIVPIAALIGGMLAVAGLDSKYKSVKTLFWQHSGLC